MTRFTLLSAFLGFLPGVAHAQLVSGGASQAAGGFLPASFAGGSGVFALNNLAYLMMTKAWTLIAIAATYNIVRAGTKLINSQEEDKLSKARRTIGASLVAVMAFYLVPKIVEAIYTAGGGLVFASPSGVSAGASVFAQELYGIIRWVEVMVIPLAIGVIVYTGLKVILSFGKEDGPADLRRAVFAIVAGILLLIVDPAIKATLGVPNFGAPGAPSTGPIIARGIDIVKQLLLFLALVSVIVVIYAGIRVVLSVGNEEDTTKSRQLLVRAVVGLAVIFISYALTSLIIQIVTAP